MSEITGGEDQSENLLKLLFFFFLFFFDSSIIKNLSPESSSRNSNALFCVVVYSSASFRRVYKSAIVDWKISFLWFKQTTGTDGEGDGPLLFFSPRNFRLILDYSNVDLTSCCSCLRYLTDDLSNEFRVLPSKSLNAIARHERSHLIIFLGKERKKKEASGLDQRYRHDRRRTTD